MEVSPQNRLILCLLFLFLGACSSKSNTGSGSFTPNENLDVCNGEIIEGQFLVKWKSGEITLEHAKSKEEFISNFLEKYKEQIEFAEHNVKLKVRPFDIIIDNSEENGFVDNWGADNIHAPAVWQQGVRGDGIVVAVIDSGVDIYHSQLSPQIYINTKEIPGNEIDDDNNGYVDDYTGYNFHGNNPNVAQNSLHGTHVAGIIAAHHNESQIVNDIVLGTAPQANILPVKFIEGQEGSIDDAIRGIDYAVAQKAKIINASWGGPKCSKSLRSKILSLADKDVLFVAAAGNDELNLDIVPTYPASFEGESLISVGAITSFNGMAHFSNYGENSVHLFAPGFGIDSTIPGQNSHERQNGTSMAAPYVAGAAALIWSHRPQAKVDQIRQALLNSTTYDSNYFNITNGRLNVEQALIEIAKLVD